MQYAHNIQLQWQQAKQRIELPERYNHTVGLGPLVSLWDEPNTQMDALDA
ncbi:MAG: hypothetical protein ACI9WC_003157 [Arenicella sp.]